MSFPFVTEITVHEDLKAENFTIAGSMNSLVAYDDSDSDTETGKPEDASTSEINVANYAMSACGGLDIISESNSNSSFQQNIFHEDTSSYYLKATTNTLPAAHLKKTYPTSLKIASCTPNQSLNLLQKPKILSENASCSQKRTHGDNDVTIQGLRPYIPKRLRQEQNRVLREDEDCRGNALCATQLDVAGGQMTIKTSEYIMPYLGSKYEATEIPRNLVFEMSEHSGPVNAIQWCPVQKWSHMLLSASMDKTIKVI